MVATGEISKMSVKLGKPVEYALNLGAQQIALNPLLGQKISLKFLQKMQCSACHQNIKKTYQDGYCYPCSKKLARCDLCIVKPERCHYHLETCREPAWGLAHCMTTHCVYLANSSGIKVGITRQSQIPTRWIDQGAKQALVLYQASTRRVSGLLEVAIAKHIADKTNWRKMLSSEAEAIDLLAYRKSIIQAIEGEVEKIITEFGSEALILAVPQVIELEYPVLSYPTKIQSLSFDKTPLIEGQLIGIKGQYLILDTGVLNVRKHTGYLIEACMYA